MSGKDTQTDMNISETDADSIRYDDDGVADDDIIIPIALRAFYKDAQVDW